MKLIKLTLIALLFTTEAIAAPVISTYSGSMTNGSMITITGSGFGSHADYNGSKSWLATRWQDFESSLLDGGQFAVLGNRTDHWSLESSSFDGSQWAKRFYLVDRNAGLQTYQTSDQPVMYAFFKYKHNYTEEGLINKYYRVYGDSREYGSIRKNYITSFNAGNGSYQLTQYAEFSNIVTNQYSSPAYTLKQMDTWVTVEVLLETETTSRARVWFDGVLRIDSNNDNDIWDLEPFGAGGHTADLGSQIGYGDGTSYLGFDDYQFNYTKAKVMICPGSTWENRGACEIQVATSWATNSVNVVVNQGAIPNGASRYLYLMASDETVSNALPVTFGGTPPVASDTQAPTLLSISPASGTQNIEAD